MLSFNWHPRGAKVIDTVTQEFVTVDRGNGVSGSADLIDRLSRMKAANESVDDYVLRMARVKRSGS